MLRLAKLTDAEYVLAQEAAGLEEHYLGSGETGREKQPRESPHPSACRW